MTAGRRYGPAAAVLGAMVGLWEAAVWTFGLPVWVLPAPSQIAVAAWEMRWPLLHHMTPTVLEATAGIAAALVAGAPLGVALNGVEVVRRGVYPLLIGSQSLPVIVVAPLLTIWFGYGLLPKVVLVAFTCFFPITVAAADGLEAADPEMLRLLRSMGATGWQRFWKARVPAALPTFFTGLKVSITYAVIAAVVSEWMGASQGIGVFMARAARSFQTDRVFAAVLLVSAMSVLLFLMVEGAARLALPWYYGRPAPRGWGRWLRLPVWPPATSRRLAGVRRVTVAASTEGERGASGGGTRDGGHPAAADHGRCS